MTGKMYRKLGRKNTKRILVKMIFLLAPCYSGSAWNVRGSGIKFSMSPRDAAKSLLAQLYLVFFNSFFPHLSFRTEIEASQPYIVTWLLLKLYIFSYRNFIVRSIFCRVTVYPPLGFSKSLLKIPFSHFTCGDKMHSHQSGGYSRYYGVNESVWKAFSCSITENDLQGHFLHEIYTSLFFVLFWFYNVSFVLLFDITNEYHEIHFHISKIFKQIISVDFRLTRQRLSRETRRHIDNSHFCNFFDNLASSSTLNILFPVVELLNRVQSSPCDSQLQTEKCVVRIGKPSFDCCTDWHRLYHDRQLLW